MAYYPPTTAVMGMTTIRRERKLPPGAVGEALVEQNSMVDPSTPVLRGAVPGAFIMLDALKPLGLKHVSELNPETMLQVQLGEVVDQGQAILEVGSGRKLKTLDAPVRAIFVRLEGSQVVLQVDPKPIELLALIPGLVTSVRGDSVVVIESIGALVQGVWGNGLGAYGAIALEPEGGIESLQGDSILQEFNGVIMVLRNPIKSPTVFMVAATQRFGALIAPSMHAHLRDVAMHQSIPIMLTEGFGEIRMSEVTYNLLRGNINRPAALDATEPNTWSADRPEVVIPLASGGTKPRAPEKDQPLTEGALVRFTRAPLAGQSGRVLRLVETPRAVENGLRLAGAEVQLTDQRSEQRVVFAPLANLELLGRPIDASGRG